MFKVRSLRSLRAVFFALIGLVLSLGAAEAAPAHRLYIKHNGIITLAIDPGGLITSGHLFSRSHEEYGVTNADRGLQFRQAGQAFMAVREPGANRDQFGTLVLGGGYIYEGFSTIPYRPTGTLVFFHTAPSTGQKVGMVEVDHNDGSIDLGGSYASRFAYRQSTSQLKNRERQLLVDAWQCVDTNFYPGSPGGSNPPDYNAVGGVSHWDKQDQIHYSFGQHTMDGGNNPAFLPWHREFINRMEDHLRGCDPLVSLPYWDWTRSPTEPGYSDGIPLMTGASLYGWFGNSTGRAGSPIDFDNQGELEASREDTRNPFYPPTTITRTVDAEWSLTTPDQELLANADYDSFIGALEGVHGTAHMSLGDFDNISDIERSPQDPVFFLLHSNADRLWTTWQRDPAHPERLTAEGVYGMYSQQWPTHWDHDGMNMYRDVVDPWSGGPGHMNAFTPLRPWTAPDGQQSNKSYIDSSIINPRPYEGPDGWSTY